MKPAPGHLPCVWPHQTVFGFCGAVRPSTRSGTEATASATTTVGA